MQRRLLISMIAVAVAAVLALGIPLAIAISRLQVKGGSQQLHRDALLAANELQERLNAGLPPGANQLAASLTDRYVVIKQSGGPVVRHGLRPALHDSMTQTVNTSDFTVSITADDSYVTGNILRALLLIGGVALAAVGIAVVLGLLYAKRLLRPLEELAGAADRLGAGDSSPLGRRYGMQELDRVAEGLDGSAQRINELLAAEREFSIDASHQLRTPLTALSMRLEEMVGAAEHPDVVREEGAAALAQTERLADVVG